MGLFISCEEATIICTKNQYKEATFLEKIKLNLHLFRCKICGAFSRQNSKLTKVCDAHLEHAHCDQNLNDEEKALMKEKITNAK